MGLSLLTGAVAATIAARSSRAWLLALSAPPGMLAPGLFAPVWAALCVTVGIAAWLVWQRVASHQALRLWGWQLLANAAWTPAFFAAQSPALAAVVAAVIVWLASLTLLSFHRVRPFAAWLLLPYLAWTCYAAYLTVGYAVLNRR